MVPDVRCPGILEPLSNTGQCQLYVGHGGEHAVLDLQDGERTLRRWLTASVTDLPFGSDIPVQLPWAPSFPSLTDEVPRLRAAAVPPAALKPARRRGHLHSVA